MEKQERKAVYRNTHDFERAILDAEVFCSSFNKMLLQAYDLGMDKLKPDEMHVIESVYTNGSKAIAERLRMSLSKTQAYASIPEVLRIETINKQFDSKDAKDLINKSDYLMSGPYWKNPLDIKHYVIDESGMLQIGDRSKISDLFTVFLETPKQKEYYKLALETRKNLARMFELRQQSEAANFKFHSFDEFMNDIQNNVIFEHGDMIEFNAECIRDI